VSEHPLDTLLRLCCSNNRVCPLPIPWNDLWELLPAKKRMGGGWEPAAPLILAAWAHTSSEQKRARLHEHLLWAEQHDALIAVGKFLGELDEDQWLHVGEWPS
jgi:hypothetical protein